MYAHVISLLLCAVTALCAIDAQGIQQPVTVYIASGPMTTPFMTNVLQAYQLVNPSADIQLLDCTDAETASMVHNTTADLALYIGAQSYSDTVIYTDTHSYPLLSVGLGFTYNLPNMQPQFRLALRASTAARILTGNITVWNDAAIQNDNQRALLPNHTIHVIVSDFNDGKNMLLSHALSSVYAPFADTIGTGFSLNWRNGTYANVTYTNDSLANAIATKLTPYSISYAAPTDTATFDLTLSNMINSFGATVTLTADSLAVAAVEIGTRSNISIYNDFSNGAGPLAWPIAAAVNLIYDQSAVRTSCEAKTQALQFITWFNTSSAVASLAQHISLLPVIVNRASQIPDLTFACENTTIQLSVSDMGKLAGSSALGTYLPSVLSFYQSNDNQRVYTATTSDQFDALERLTAGGIDVAVVQPDMLNHTDLATWTSYLDSGALVVLPAAVAATIMSFRLPDVILNAVGNFTDPLYGPCLTGQPGWTVDTPTLSAIYTGNINDWTHPNMSLYSPWLGERVAALQAIDPNITIPITLVVCCEDPTVDTPAAQIMAWGFAADLDPNGYLGGINYVPDGFDYTTGIANDYYRWQLPYSWQTNLTQLGNSINYVMMTSETQLAETTALIDGSISYYLQTADEQDPTTMISIMYPDLEDFSNLDNFAWTAASVDNNLACVLIPYSTDVSYFSLQLDNLDQTAACYSFATLVSYAVLSHYNDGNSFPISVASANKTLNMVQWLLSNDVLNAAARSHGIGLMSNLPEYNNATIYAIEYITCNGFNCLITLPTYWSLGNAVSVAGYTIGCTMCTICVVTAIYMWTQRYQPIIRSASITFQLLILLGLTMAFLGAVLIVQPPTLASCSAFAWLADFGLQLTFVPLFLKMYRIYRIFSRKQLKIVKLTDLKLLSYGAVLLMFDLVIMIAWQTTYPLQPIITHVYNSVNDHQYLQCDLTGSAVDYVIVLGAEKGALLLFGCIMSFSTRKVNGTFNESTTVAWSIYNTILAAVVMISIISVVGALGDSFIIMIVIIILWIGISIYVLMFATKLYAMAMDKMDLPVSNIEVNNSMVGFSFVSVDQLSAANIHQYLRALEAHMKVVQHKKRDLTGADKRVTDEGASHVHRQSGQYQNSPHMPASPMRPSRLSNTDYQHEYVAPVRRERPSFVGQFSSRTVVPLGASPVTAYSVRRLTGTAVENSVQATVTG